MELMGMIVIAMTTTMSRLNDDADSSRIAAALTENVQVCMLK